MGAAHHHAYGMRWGYLGLALALGLMGGCAALDWVFGVSPEGNRPSPGGSSPAEAAGGLLSFLFPWASSLALLLTNAYAWVRGRRWGKIASTAIEGISVAKGMKDQSGKVDLAALLEHLAKLQDAAGVREEVRKLAHEAESKLPSPEPPSP